VALQPTFYLGQFLTNEGCFFAALVRSPSSDFCLSGFRDRWRQSWKKFGWRRQEWPPSHGLELVEIELVGPTKERVLRVFLEKTPKGGRG